MHDANPTKDEHNLIREEQTKVAIKYYESFRAEILERLKMRDQILLAYVGAVVALFGYAAKPPSSASFDYLTMLQSTLFQALPDSLAAPFLSRKLYHRTASGDDSGVLRVFRS